MAKVEHENEIMCFFELNGSPKNILKNPYSGVRSMHGMLNSVRDEER